MNINAIRAIIAERYNGQVPKYNKLWRGRELAIARQFGSWEGSYALIIPLNPGSVYSVLSMPTGKDGYRYFTRAAWAFGPCIASIPTLRPVITIDACFLSGRYHGKLLMACGYDAENQLVPIAFGLVEKEDFENWEWFMQWVRRYVIGDRFMCVISDRHMGIKKVFRQEDLGWNEDDESQCVHRLCSQHVAENMKKNTGSDPACKHFKIGVKKKKPRRYEEMVKAIESCIPSALTWLEGVRKYRDNDEEELPKPQKIFQALDGGYHWGIMTTNGSESLNNVFKQSRQLPVAAIIEDTFYKCVKWFGDRRLIAETCSAESQIWSTRVHKLLDKRILKSSRMKPLGEFGDHREFEVTSVGENVQFYMDDGRRLITNQDCKYRVIIRSETEVECTCQKPQLTRISCVHVLSVCRLRKLDANMFVSPYYSIQTLINTWSGQFHVYANQCEWPEYIGPILVPEERLITVGRRRHNRISSWMDNLARRRGHQTIRATMERNARNAQNSQGSSRTQ